MKLSVIIPVYNEEQTIYELIHQVNNQKKNIILEIIVVDDFSSDGSFNIIREIVKKKPINQKPKLIISQNAKNIGKGGTLKSGFKFLYSW